MRFSLSALAIAAFLGAPFIHAQQLSTVPDLSTATQSTSSTSAASTTSAATTSSSAVSTSSSSSSAPITSSSSASTTSGSSASSTTGSIFSLSSLPTIAGAGIPTMIVPYTAGAPFMQKSSLPEGTVFIAVGAVLAFLGACVLLWRGLVAWSINRSVKRAALASIRAGNEKTTTTNWGGSGTGYNPAKGSMYKNLGSSMSMEALTSAGKPVKSHFKDHDTGRNSPTSSLFFSPTAQARSDAPRPPSEVYANRNSAYLPAGYYASPAAQAAGGARATTIGGNLAPYARTSVADPSPPTSPNLAPTRYGAHNQTSTRDYPRASSRDGLGQNPPMYTQPSHSSLMVGLGDRGSSDGLAGSRAPSAYLDDLFENHTAMASRDRLS